MKKKTYIIPALTVQTIQLTNMVCLSGEMKPKEEITSSEGFGARKNFSVWGDDEDEE